MNLTAHNFKTTKENRESIKNQKSQTIWMSGLSGSGKSTIANLVEEKLINLGYHTFILDGDNTRLGLNKGLGFSEEDRIERKGIIQGISVEAFVSKNKVGKHKSRCLGI